MPTEAPRARTYRCLKVEQPLGDFYIASIPADELVEITWFDVRRIMRDEREIESYLGVQRPLNPKRVEEIRAYVTGADACFPTGVIVAVPGVCVELSEDESEITLKNFIDEEDDDNNIFFRSIAKVLDGQHRLAGLDRFEGTFGINVSIFVDADIADQANIFSTVNLAQTKVNRSLAYDLYDLMRSRSPQKTAHNVAVTLDNQAGSPFFKKLKRLGVATPGRTGETLTQAAFVQPLLPYLSSNPEKDRRLMLEGKTPKKVDQSGLVNHPFQHLFVDEEDFLITDIVWNYFEAVRLRWTSAWENSERGNRLILNRTTGYSALVRFLRIAYIELSHPGKVVKVEEFSNLFNRIELDDEDFHAEKYLPGSGGQSALFKDLCEMSGVITDGLSNWERRKRYQLANPAER